MSERDKRARRRAIRKRRRKVRSSTDPASELPLPDCEVDFLEGHVFWRHMITKEPVSALSDIARDYVETRTAFRWDENGDRVAGADIIGKPRRVYMTSIVLGLVFYTLIRWPGLRALTVVQVSRHDIIKPLIEQVRYMLSRLPDEWVPGNGSWVGSTVTLPGDSTWSAVSAGYSEATANKVGRSGAIDIAHYTETAFWPHPEALHGAVSKALPPATGWLVSESTLPPDPAQWHAAELIATLENPGQRFLKGFFWPWHAHPDKRIPTGSPFFLAMHDPSFPVSDEDRAQEFDLGLDPEQVAFRRKEYLTGESADARRTARRENPEAIEDAFAPGDDQWLSEAALLECDKAVMRPIFYDQVGQFRVLVWQRLTSGLVMGVDCAEMGKDSKAVVFIDYETGDQVAQVHGQGLDSQFADAIVMCISETLETASTADGDGDKPRQLVCDRNRYFCMLERARAKGTAAELERRGVELAKDARTSGRWGVSTDRHSRPIYFDRIQEVIEGRPDDSEAWDTPTPIVAVRSSLLISELRQLVDRDGRKETARAGQHDDLVMAFGIALYSRRRWKRRFSYDFPTRPARRDRQRSRGTRHGDSAGPQ